MPPTYRPLDEASPWFPKPPHPDQEAEGARRGLPVAVEHLASEYVLVLVPGSLEIEPFYLGATPVTYRTVMRVMKADPENGVALKPLPALRDPSGRSWTLRDALKALGSDSAPSVLIPDAGADRQPRYKASNEERIDLPATDLTVEEIAGFLKWAGGGLILPLDSWWSAAAKFDVPNDARYWWGGVFEGGKANTAWELRRRPNRPGEYPPTTLGLYDMIGNVWEMCRNSGEDTSYFGSRGDEPRFVLKGGSWATVPEFATIGDLVEVDRVWQNEHWHDPYVGFRCAASWSDVLSGLPPLI